MGRALTNKPRQKTVYDFAVLLYPESAPAFKGYYNAIVPALPGCVSYRERRTEALKTFGKPSSSTWRTLLGRRW